MVVVIVMTVEVVRAVGISMTVEVVVSSEDSGSSNSEDSGSSKSSRW